MISWVLISKKTKFHTDNRRVIANLKETKKRDLDYNKFSYD